MLLVLCFIAFSHVYGCIQASLFPWPTSLKFTVCYSMVERVCSLSLYAKSVVLRVLSPPR